MGDSHCVGGCDGCGGGIACLWEEVERLREALIRCQAQARQQGYEKVLHISTAALASGEEDADG